MSEPHPTIRPQPGILEISPYVAGESKSEGANRVTKLSSNENPLGPSPRAKAAYVAAAEGLERYPASDHGALRTAIGEVHGLDPAMILCGAGSDEIIALLCQAYAGPGDEVIHTEHGFLMYEIGARSVGATPISVPERERHTDVDAILSAVTERTRLVFVANPNNPTGTMVSGDTIARLAEALPPHVLLVLDGAYAEYVQLPGFDAGRGLVESRENVVMTRTFSKVYGLGGLRVGWCYAPGHVIDVLHRIRGPFNVGAAGLAAAEAAVRDVDYTAHCVAENAHWRDWLAAELEQMGLSSDPSFGNFILVRFRNSGIATACDGWLREHGVIVRQVTGYGLPQCLRITIGDEVACGLVARLVGEFVKAGRA